MDPQVKSTLTSILMLGAGAVATWAANKGIIPNGDQPVLTNELVTVAFGLIAAGIAWYKARSQSQTALIAAVNNANNGVKVVDAKVIAPTVTAPTK